MNKKVNWHKIFNNINFSYYKDSKYLKKTNYFDYSFNLQKIIYPGLTFIKFKKIIMFIENSLKIKKKNSILDFGSGNGALLNYFIKKYDLRNNFSFELSRPLVNFQKKFITKTFFYQTNHTKYNVFKKIDNNMVDYSISNSVFQYFYSNLYCYRVLDFLIRVTKKSILIYDIKNLKRKIAYKNQVRIRQNLSKAEFRKKYKNTPIRFYEKNFFIKILNQFKKKYNLKYKFIPMPVSATDSRFGYCLLISKY